MIIKIIRAIKKQITELFYKDRNTTEKSANFNLYNLKVFKTLNIVISSEEKEHKVFLLEDGETFRCLNFKTVLLDNKDKLYTQIITHEEDNCIDFYIGIVEGTTISMSEPYEIETPKGNKLYFNYDVFPADSYLNRPVLITLYVKEDVTNKTSIVMR